MYMKLMGYLVHNIDLFKAVQHTVTFRPMTADEVAIIKSIASRDSAARGSNLNIPPSEQKLYAECGFNKYAHSGLITPPLFSPLTSYHLPPNHSVWTATAFIAQHPEIFSGPPAASSTLVAYGASGGAGVAAATALFVAEAAAQPKSAAKRARNGIKPA